MQITASLVGLSVVTIFAALAIQAMQPTPVDIAARHYGLILVDNPASDFKMKRRQADKHRLDGDGPGQAASTATSDPDGICAGSLNCKEVKLSAE